MEYTKLGATGLQVSKLCLGTMTYGSPKWRPWVLDEQQSRPFLKRAVEAGINFFDTADMYSDGASEEVLGRALRDFAKRDEVVIATKVFNPMGDGPNMRGLGRKHIMQAVDASLRRLGTDYIDLYQIHRFDDATPIEETLEALNDVVRAGKALYIGASSMFAWQFAKSLAISDSMGWARFVSMQNFYNLIYREEEREMLPLCADQGVGVIPWSPLGRGFLAGTMPKDSTPATDRAKSEDIAKRLRIGESTDYDVLAAVESVAARHERRPAQVALAWLLHKPIVTAPIFGASKMQHIDDALAALEIELDDDDIAALEAPYAPHPVAGHR